MMGTDTGVGTYSGSPGRPNVFQAQQTQPNSVTWLNIPFDDPGNGTRILRFTNLRVNAQPFPVGSSILIATPVTSSPSIVVTGPPQTVAFVTKGVTFSAGNI